MLVIHVGGTEYWDERNEKFIYDKEYTIQLEHSLISVSKWESKWEKPYLSQKNMTDEEIIDYIKCMTLTQNVPNNIYDMLSSENISEIAKYIEAPMTATWFSNTEPKGKINNEQVTSELIYYWMIALQIPFECQKWHLNRLLTLIRVCNIKNQPPKKMSANEIAKRNRALNEARRKTQNTRG